MLFSSKHIGHVLSTFTNFIYRRRAEAAGILTTCSLIAVALVVAPFLEFSSGTAIADSPTPLAAGVQAEQVAEGNWGPEGSGPVSTAQAAEVETPAQAAEATATVPADQAYEPAASEGVAQTSYSYVETAPSTADLSADATVEAAPATRASAEQKAQAAAKAAYETRANTPSAPEASPSAAAAYASTQKSTPQTSTRTKASTSTTSHPAQSQPAAQTTPAAPVETTTPMTTPAPAPAKAVTGCTHVAKATAAEEATCTQVGYTAGTVCALCGTTLSGREVIPSLHHSVVFEEGYPATCITTGLTEGAHCATCGKVLIAQQVIPATGHVYRHNVNPETATCSDVCLTCGEAAHHWVDGENGEAPHCEICFAEKID